MVGMEEHFYNREASDGVVHLDSTAEPWQQDQQHVRAVLTYSKKVLEILKKRFALSACGCYIIGVRRKGY